MIRSCPGRRRFCAAFLLALALPDLAGAQLSKEELLELGASDLDLDAMIQRVEAECVDFEVDAAALAGLAGRVPRSVLQAAMDCGGPDGESRECGYYRALAEHPGLQDFPTVFLWIRGGDVGVLEVSSATWLEERGVRGFKQRFKELGEHGGRHLVAVDVVKNLPGVKTFAFEESATLTSEELARMQAEAILRACSKPARLTVTVEPASARVRIDGREYRAQPVRVKLLPDEHLIEVSAEGFETYSRNLFLRDGENRELHVALEPRATLALTSEPSDAVVVLNGSFAGHTPMEVFLDPGRHRLRLVASGRPAHDEELVVETGELLNLDVSFPEPDGGSPCFDAVQVTGSIDKAWKQFGAELVGAELELLVPLYEVVSSTMEREVPATHVLDARRVLFRPGTYKQFVDRPADLLGIELGGVSFGETAVEIIESAPGPVTILGVERKKSALRVDLLHHSGDQNAIFLDFTPELGFVQVSDALAALCAVAVSR